MANGMIMGDCLQNDNSQFVGTKKKVQKCIDKISGQGERE